MNYRILVVDDEPLARERLKRLLQEHGDFEVVAEAGDGESALSWLRQYRCDLVLLDIQMPGKTGLQVAEAIQELDHVPLVVFCTAYDEHALQAFRVKAIDYLMKPIAKADLSRRYNEPPNGWINTARMRNRYPEPAPISVPERTMVCS